MKTKYTPGPWSIRSQHGNGIAKYIERDDHGLKTIIATVHGGTIEFDGNCNLIQSAPELLVCLKKCVEDLYMEYGGDESFMSPEVVQGAQLIKRIES